VDILERTSKSSPSLPDFRRTEEAFHSLLRAYGLIRQVMEPYFARFGISASQWAILRVLQRAELAGETALRLTELGRRLLIQPPSVTGVVDRLEREGFVARRASKADQRVRQVSLTPSGRKLVAKVLLEGHTAQIQSLFSAHTEKEMELLRDLLKKLVKHLGNSTHFKT
jgi:DNA-binding MarR family transcriptional regulator